MSKEKSAKSDKIKEILQKRASPLASEIEHADILSLAKTIRERVVQELADELIEKGLDTRAEPNAYGRELESLIDDCGLTKD